MTDSTLLQDGVILFGTLIIGLIIGGAVGAIGAGTYANYQCHPETNPENISWVVVGQYSNGETFYFDLKGDDGITRMVSTTNPEIGYHIRNGTFYKFTLKRMLGAYQTYQIDQQVYP